MSKLIFSFVSITIIAVATILMAQQPRFAGGGNQRGGGDIVAASVARMMAFDENGDGNLSKSEVADSRLASLFDRADVDQDGSVSKDELTALFSKEAGSLRSGGPAGPGGPPPGGPLGGRFGPRAGGPGPRPRLGEVLPRFIRDELQLSRRQQAQLDKLQADVDERLAEILTEEQFQQFNEMRDRGPGGPPPGGPGDFGPPRREGAPPPRED